MWSHCNDGAAFIGYAGDLNKDIFNGLKANNCVNEMKTAYELTDEEREWFISTPDKEHSITFYVFKCLHCGEIGGYGDFTYQVVYSDTNYAALRLHRTALT